MLAVSVPLSNPIKDDERQEQMGSYVSNGSTNEEFSVDLLESINFDDLFMGINDEDALPDLEMDPEIFGDFSISSGGGGGGEESEMNSSASSEKFVLEADNSRKEICHEGEDKNISGFGSGLDTKRGEIGSKNDASNIVVGSNESDKGRKPSSTQAKNNQGKRKVKVDWTPELHRRFVQAVEQLGVDKAVPSRILELMGIDYLTRHNIASHLQKYRSHRKHLLAREAEAATWSHKRQMYGVAGVGGGGKRNMTPWHAPTMGFPPVAPPMHPHPHPHFRPLHVWGHPPVEQPVMHMWPKHMPNPPPPATWPPPPPDASFWHHQQRPQQVPNGVIPAGTPCFPPQPMAHTRFAATPVPGIPPHGMYKVDPPPRHSGPQPIACDFQPSKETIDAAIGDVLSKPWLPLPLGLKPPSVDGVLGELQRQGVAKIPPTCA